MAGSSARTSHGAATATLAPVPAQAPPGTGRSRRGAPPMGGLGLGVDRLIMLLAGEQDPEHPGTVVRQPGIRETILFPLMKPES